MITKITGQVEETGTKETLVGFEILKPEQAKNWETFIRPVFLKCMARELVVIAGMGYEMHHLTIIISYPIGGPGVFFYYWSMKLGRWSMVDYIQMKGPMVIKVPSMPVGGILNA